MWLCPSNVLHFPSKILINVWFHCLLNFNVIHYSLIKTIYHSECSEYCVGHGLCTETT